jgi:hypothetical protein
MLVRCAMLDAQHLRFPFFLVEVYLILLLFTIQCPHHFFNGLGICTKKPIECILMFE